MKEELICHQFTTISSPALLRSQKWQTSKMRPLTDLNCLNQSIWISIFTNMIFISILCYWLLFINFYLIFISIIIIILCPLFCEAIRSHSKSRSVNQLFLFQVSLENGSPGYSRKRSSINNNSHNLFKKSLKVRKIKMEMNILYG